MRPESLAKTAALAVATMALVDLIRSKMGKTRSYSNSESNATVLLGAEIQRKYNRL
jgi:hypothetical protein